MNNMLETKNASMRHNLVTTCKTKVEPSQRNSYLRSESTSANGLLITRPSKSKKCTSNEPRAILGDFLLNPFSPWAPKDP